MFSLWQQIYINQSLEGFDFEVFAKRGHLQSAWKPFIWAVRNLDADVFQSVLGKFEIKNNSTPKLVQTDDLLNIFHVIMILVM